MNKTTQEGRVERQIELGLQPGRFISELEGTSGFIDGLAEVRASIDALVLKGRARQAAGFHETFLAGCAAKAEELDDSYGNFGSFVQTLVCGWVLARRAAGLDAGETARILLRWENRDDYGFFSGIERELAETFNRAERIAYTKAVRALFDEELRKAGGPGHPRPYYDAPYPLRKATDILKTLYESGRDAQSYTGLCDVMETSPRDCERIARILQRRGKLEQALEWVERSAQAGLGKAWPNQEAHELGTIKRELLKGLGRHEDALRHAWEEFVRHPGEYSYGDLMGCVPKRERAVWHAKAMAASDCAALDSCIGLYMKTHELFLLAARVGRASEGELRGLYYSVAIEAAEKLAGKHPSQAAALYSGQALRILGRKKSRLYDTALRYFSEARRCYGAAGQSEEWRRLSDRVLREHARKYSFFSKFQELAAGGKTRQDPSFLTRARRRWDEKLRGEPS